jgi:GT2 family glycosyltransferase
MSNKKIKILHAISYYLLEDVFFKCHQSLVESINLVKNKNFENKVMIIVNSKLLNKNFYLSNPINILVDKKKNLGFTGSANFAFKYALDHGYDAVNLINQDIIFPKKTIPSLIKIFRDCKIKNKIGILSPVQLDDYSQYDPKIDSNLKKILQNKNQDKKIFLKVKFVNAACWLVNADLIKLLGSMNPLLDHFGSDDDYVNRMNKIKFNLYILPGVCVYHLRSFYKRQVRNSYRVKQLVSEIHSYIYLKILEKKNFFYIFLMVFFKIIKKIFKRNINLKIFIKIFNKKLILNMKKIHKYKEIIYIPFV